MQHYTDHSARAAIAAFGASQAAVSYFDGDFVVVEETVVCLFTMSPHGSASLASSSRLTWSAPQSRRASFLSLESWPQEVVDVFDRSGAKIVRKRQHQLFLRRTARSDYTYVGPAHLESYGADGRARFELATRLPREHWNALGGYVGWMFERDHAESRIDEGDDDALVAQLAEFATQSSSHIVLTRYEEDALHVYKNERTAWVMYLRDPTDTGLYPVPAMPASTGQTEHFRCDCGIDLEFPSGQCLPIAQALDIVRGFFAAGELPSDHNWSDTLP
jgi:hypothetical protein